MTLITAMKFNAHEGAIIADEESTDSNRKYLFSMKISQIEANDVVTLFGGTGMADVLYDSSMEIKKRLEKHKSKLIDNQAMANYIANVFGDIRRKYTDSYLWNKYGISEAEFHTGQKMLPDGRTAPIDKSIMEQYHQTVQERNDFSEMIHNAFLIMTKDPQSVDLFIASMKLRRATPVPRPYSAVGSGYDIADAELYNFFEHISREEREKINPLDGLAALLYATERASVRNVGVGGTPHIKVIHDDKILDPSENNSLLALEITKATSRGFLSKKFQREALDALIYQNADYKSMNAEMHRKAENQEKLNLFLRGYKCQNSADCY